MYGHPEMVVKMMSATVMDMQPACGSAAAPEAAGVFALALEAK